MLLPEEGSTTQLQVVIVLKEVRPQGSVGVLARSSGTSLGGAPIVPPLFYSKDVATFPTLMLFTD